MSGAAQTNDVRQPGETGLSTATSGEAVPEAPTAGRWRDHDVTPGAGGAAYASSCNRATTTRGGIGEEELESNAELMQLAQEAEESCNQLTDDLQQTLGLSPDEATEQVGQGVRKLLQSQLKKIAAMRRGRLRHRRVCQFRRFLSELACLDAQIRCYSRYAFRRLRPDWSEERRKERARTASLHELLADLGYDRSAVDRYHEHRRVAREHAAHDALNRLGFGPRLADSYLQHHRAQAPAQFLPLLDELIEIERNPAQHPLRPRAGTQQTAGSSEAQAAGLVQHLDAVLALRAAARRTLQDAEWPAALIAAQLRGGSLAELQAIAAALSPPPLPTAPPEPDEFEFDASDELEPGQEGVPDATSSHDDQTTR